MNQKENFPEWYREKTLREPLLKELATLGFLKVLNLKKHEVPTLLSIFIRGKETNAKRREIFGDVEVIW